MRENMAIKVVLGLLAAVFLFHQLYSSFYKPITTYGAEYYEASDGLTVSATVIRTERPITCDTAGTLHFSVPDGGRVQKGGVIAQVYDNASASITVSNIEELEKQVNSMEQMLGYNDRQAADLDLINSKADSAANNYILSCSYGDFATAQSSENDLINCINRRKLITGEQTDFTAQLTALKTELEKAKASLPSAKANIYADVSGYFASYTDGYEQTLVCDDLDSITPEFLNEIKPAKTPDNVIGKMVSDYEWYIAANVTLDQSLKYKVGDILTVDTGIKSCPTLSVTVNRINVSAAGDSATVILACSNMNSELSTLRRGTMTIVSKTYKGLRLPKKALRVVDDKTGVYVVSGMSLKFVPAEVIYSTSDNEYIICKQEKSNDDVLRIYDEVVVKGRNPYDGKIIG